MAIHRVTLKTQDHLRNNKHVLLLPGTFHNYGNPFEGEHLVTAVTDVTVGEESENVVVAAKKNGQDQYQTYMKERLIECT